MYTLNQAIAILKKKPMGLSFVWYKNKDVHIFKDVDGEICKGEYGNGEILYFKDVKDRYSYGMWLIDFKGSKYRVKKD